MSKGKKRSGARPGRPQPLRGTKGKRKGARRSEERFSRNAETDLVCRLLLEKKNSLMLITDSIARQLPDCRAWSAAFPEYNRPRSFANFKLVYRLEMAVITFAIFLLLLHLLQRCLPHEGSAERWERLLTFVLGLMLLRHAAFDRLDTVVGALLLLALGLMLSVRSAVWSFGVLALAIAFKIAPVALAPLWVIGSLPGALLAGTRTGGGWRRLL